MLSDQRLEELVIEASYGDAWYYRAGLTAEKEGGVKGYRQFYQAVSNDEYLDRLRQEGKLK